MINFEFSKTFGSKWFQENLYNVNQEHCQKHSRIFLSQKKKTHTHIPSFTGQTVQLFSHGALECVTKSALTPKICL